MLLLRASPASKILDFRNVPAEATEAAEAAEAHSDLVPFVVFYSLAVAHSG